jgi:hypothetical protein
VLEGPEHSVFVRGREDGKVIALPNYWKDLVHERSITVQLTPIGFKQDLWVREVNSQYIMVENESGPDVDYYYYVMAERKDVPHLVVER